MLSNKAIDVLRPLIMPFIAALIIAVVTLIFVRQCSNNANLATEARTARSQGEAGTTSAKGASDLSRETENVIRETPGADAPVPADLNRVAIDRLCLRRAYRCEPLCLQRARAAGVADAGAGCADPR